MKDFLLQIILFGSLGVVAYVIARALPRLGEEESDARLFKSLMSYIPTQKMDLAFSSFLEKTLRKARVTVLRIDNSLMGYLGKVKNGNGNGRQKSLFNGLNDLENKNSQEEEA